ncbi:MAG: hypothetical protein AB8G95_03380 [Anaerolineae bacterium]
MKTVTLSQKAIVVVKEILPTTGGVDRLLIQGIESFIPQTIGWGDSVS